MQHGESVKSQEQTHFFETALQNWTQVAGNKLEFRSTLT